MLLWLYDQMFITITEGATDERETLGVEKDILLELGLLTEEAHDSWYTTFLKDGLDYPDEGNYVDNFVYKFNS